MMWCLKRHHRFQIQVSTDEGLVQSYTSDESWEEKKNLKKSSLLMNRRVLSAVALCLKQANYSCIVFTSPSNHSHLKKKIAATKIFKGKKSTSCFYLGGMIGAEVDEWG